LRSAFGLLEEGLSPSEIGYERDTGQANQQWKFRVDVGGLPAFSRACCLTFASVQERMPVSPTESERSAQLLGEVTADGEVCMECAGLDNGSAQQLHQAALRKQVQAASISTRPVTR
jgi:hypothetical protein